MGLTHIIKTANSGLTVTQTSIDVVARNIANAGTEGYTRKTTAQENLIAGDQGMGARITAVNRDVDKFVQEQLFIEESRLANVQTISEFLDRIDDVFGNPGGASALDTRFNEFTQSLQDLSTQPESFAARAAVVAQGEAFAGQLRHLTESVQNLRQLAEDSIADGVEDLNNIFSRLKEVNGQISAADSVGAEIAGLKDQRDMLVNRISEYMEVTVTEDVTGRAIVYSKSGNVLIDSEAVQLSFDRNGALNANALYSVDDAEREVGTIKLNGSNGYQVDLIQNGILTTGKLGALIEIRDQILPQTQRQLDDLAHGLVLSLANYDVQGTAVTAGAAAGFDIDISNVKSGNVISLNYTDNVGGNDVQVSIVRVDSATSLPLSNDITSDPNDIVIGVDFSAGDAAIAAALNTALGADITVSNPGAGVIRIVDDGAVNNTDINSLNATVTATNLQDEGLGMPLFIDTGNNLPYTGTVEGGYQKTGFAGRIVINGQVQDNPELLVKYSAATPIGDNARPNDLIARLKINNFQFGADTGIGLPNSPFVGSIEDFAQNIVNFQTSQAERAELNLGAQEAVTNSLREKYETDTGVNIDEELASLIALQQAFAANARVIGVAGEMMDILIRTI